MSDVRLVESLVPGLGHIRRGLQTADKKKRRLFFASAARFLVYTVAWGLIFVFRFGAILDCLMEPTFEHLVAVLFMAMLPGLLIWLAHRSLQRMVNPPSKEGMGTWQLAWLSILRNPRGVWGLALLGLIYMVMIIAPILAPFDEEHTPRETVVVKFLPPGSKAIVFGSMKSGKGERPCHGFTVDGDVLVLDRGTLAQAKDRYARVKISDLADHTSADPEKREPWRGWSVRPSALKSVDVGGQRVSYHVDRYWFGTDTNGRDLLSRVVYGSRVSLSIGLLAMIVAVTLGVFFGSTAGYFGGWIDSLIMRLVDILLAFPRLLLLLLIVSSYEGAGIFTVAVILGATGWMGVSRLVRAEFLKIKELDYAAAAKAFGFGTNRIMFRHLLPNAMAPVIVNATLLVGNTILVEAGLSFLGFGVQPPEPTWGNIISDGRLALQDAPWLATIPGLCIVATVVCVNMVGDALRDALKILASAELAARNHVPLKPWQQSLHTVIFEADTRGGRAFDLVLLVAILLSVVVVSLDSVSDINARYGDALRAIEWTLTILFTIEYVLRLMCVGRPLKYAFSFFGLVDLLSILPTYLSGVLRNAQSLNVIRGLRLLRIFRILKLGHFTGQAEVLTTAVRASIPKIIVFIGAVLTTVLIVGALMYMVEGEASGFTSIPQSAYWAIVTLTTVGYGDIAPQTPLGKAIASILMILGYGIIAVPTGIVTVEVARRTPAGPGALPSVSTQACQQCSAEGHDVDAKYCNQCGASL